MPAWEDFLTDEEIWSVTMFLYNHTGLEAPGDGRGGAQCSASVTPPAWRRWPGGALALVAAFATPRPQAAAPAAGADAAGRVVYEKWCAGCHGDQGKGDGVAAGHLLPKPRDFTRALYQVRSTATGEVPTDEDLRHVIDEGMGGTSMPAWKAVLSSDERAAVMRYVKSFSSAFATPSHALSYAAIPAAARQRPTRGARCSARSSASSATATTPAATVVRRRT